jgi:hypothetical protein
MKKLVLTYFLIALISFGCDTTTSPNREATQLTMSELNSTIGYEYFKVGYERYKPDTTLIKQIKQEYKGNLIYLYVNPSCACIGTTTIFPSLMKCLFSAGVPEANCKIYSMLDAGYTHNMMSKFSIKSLPGCMVEKNSTNYYSLVDSMDIYQIMNPKDTFNLIEKMILKSLK